MLPWLQFDFTPQQLFASKKSFGTARDAIAQRFGREDNLYLIIVESASDTIYTPQVLDYLHSLTLGLRRIERARSADSITTFALPRASDGALTTRPVFEERMQAQGRDWLDPGEAKFDAETAQRLASVAKGEPLLQGRLVDQGGKRGVVFARIDDEIQSASDFEAFDQKVSQLLEALPPPPQVARIDQGGIPRVRAEIMESLKSEQITFVPITGTVYILVLLFLFRRPAGALIPLGTVALAAAYTVAMMVLTESPINIVNNVLITLIFIIGISDSVHMLTRQAEELELGRDKEGALKAMIEHTGLACLLTSATTAIGFVSLLAADAAILKDFGWQAAAGVMFAYVTTLLFLPPALSFLRPVRRTKSGMSAPGRVDLSRPLGAESPWLERGLVGLGRMVLGRPKAFIVGCLAVTAGFVALSTRVDVDAKLLEVYDKGHPTYRTTRMLEESFGGFLPVDISISHPEPDHFKSPEAFAHVKEFQDFAMTRPGFLASQSMVDFHQAARVALFGDQAQREVMPDSRAQIEQIQLLIEGPPDSRDGVRAFVNPRFDNARVLLRVADFGAKKMIVESEALGQKLDELFPPEQGYEVIIGGDAYVGSLALDSFIRDLLSSLMLASVIIFLMMTVVFRSIKMGLISVVPNLTPLMVTFGYMGATGVNLNTTTVIIFAISLGLAVDDTIHFLARFKEELPQHDTVYEALLYTYYGAGRAILLTSVLLLAGLGVLTMSTFIPTQQFGKLTAFTILGAVFGDLLLLPPILLLAYRKRPPVSPPLLEALALDALGRGGGERSVHRSSHAGR